MNRGVSIKAVVDNLNRGVLRGPSISNFLSKTSLEPKAISHVAGKTLCTQMHGGVA